MTTTRPYIVTDTSTGQPRLMCAACGKREVGDDIISYMLGYIDAAKGEPS